MQIEERRATSGRNIDAPLDVEDLREHYATIRRTGQTWAAEGYDRRLVPIDDAVETIISWL